MTNEGLGPSPKELGLDPEKEGLKDGSEKDKEKEPDNNEEIKQSTWKPDIDTVRRIQGKIEEL